MILTRRVHRGNGVRSSIVTFLHDMMKRVLVCEMKFDAEDALLKCARVI